MNATARWPADYIALDGGRMLVHPHCLAAFVERGWRTLDALMNADVDVVRKIGERDNCRIEIDGRNGYLKRHWQRRLSLWMPPGIQEANAVGWCQRADAPTMGLIAAGAEPKMFGRRSFFLSEEIAGGTPADDLWKTADRRTRERIVVATAETARRFHSAGLYHRDFYWCHFFVRPTGAGWAAHLIDLQRVLRRPLLGWRWRVKDLGQFWFSAPSDATAEDRREWFNVYFDRRRQSTTEWAALLRAGLYRLKDGRP